ncbi:cytochrome c oxidase assembly protein [Fictibacillus norfolkensis]|nr:cytochrome c oxidase assembly protein [Fictibacillus norfolkensis]
MHDHHLVTDVMNSESVRAGLILFPIIIFMLYVGAVMRSNIHRKKWPMYRTLCMALGMICIAVSVVGPLAEEAHVSFIAHMLSHLLLGMIAPLLIVMAHPLTLLLRTLSVSKARMLTSLLKMKFIHVLMNPFIAATLNIGGLWLLYTTDLYMLMHQYLWVFVFIHLHLFIAGYLFTASILSIDPTAPKHSYGYRSFILVIALAGHGMLSKFIYVNPPAGVPLKQAEDGSMLMYYGGDLVDLVLIFILCLQWYKAARPRPLPVPHKMNL